MGITDYHFTTSWRVQGAVQEVSEILADAPGLVRWWPSVYLDVTSLASGDETGLGRAVRAVMKGWLPFTLACEFRVAESHPPTGFRVDATGDLVGRGIWTFAQDGPWVDISYDWRVRGNKPLLRYFSFLLKPAFSANHHWAMARGQESLKLELARRHAPTPEERAKVPPPPGPTPTSAVRFLGRLVTRRRAT